MEVFRISLKAARVNANMTAKQVSEDLHKTEKTILSWENGITPIPVDQFYKLCGLYKIKPDYVQVPVVDDGIDNDFVCS